MADKSFPEKKAEWLTYLVFLLLTSLSFLAAFQYNAVAKIQGKIGDLPKEYINKDQYNTDSARTEKNLDKINIKLDKLIERLIP